MNPITFPESNKSLGANPNQTEVKGAEVLPLPVWTDGIECVSCWQMSWRERLQALLYGKVWLRVVFGSSQPPVSIHVDKTIFI